jgi:hypothetical protein
MYGVTRYTSQLMTPFTKLLCSLVLGVKCASIYMTCPCFMYCLPVMSNACLYD